MKSGAVFQGVLKAVSPKLSIALALAHNKAKELTRTNTERLMQLEFADIISVSVLPDMNPTLGSKGELSSCEGRTLKCQGLLVLTQISSRQMPKSVVLMVLGL